MYVFVMLKEQAGLALAFVVQLRIYAAALHNTLHVIICLPVADKVYFLNTQNSSTFAF